MPRAEFFSDLAVIPCTNSLVVVDETIEAAYAGARRCRDPDAVGILDTMDHFAGIGFAICQKILAICVQDAGMEKGAALDLGPRANNRITVVSLVNAAANHWKHVDEWGARDGNRRRDRTIGVLSEVPGIDETAYPIYAVLAYLSPSQPPRFGDIVPLFLAWRKELHRVGC